MKKIKSLSLAVLAAMTLSGCNDVLDPNINPDMASSNTAENGLAPVVFFANQLVYDHAEYGIYLSQCLTTTGKSEKGDKTYRYGWGNFLTMQRHPQWRRHFYDIGVNTNDVIDSSRKLGSPNYELIVNTLMLMSTQLTTDAFGDMPRTEAYKSMTPKYDTQASLYAWMFEEVDRLLAQYDDVISNPPATMRVIDAKKERIYAGDLNKWRGLVLAVKARLLLRNLPNIDSSAKTCQEIINAAQAAIDCWRSGDIYDHNGIARDAWFGNEPRYYFDGGTAGKAAVWGPGSPRFDSWQSYPNDLSSVSVPSKFFVRDLMGICYPDDENKIGTYKDRKAGVGADPRLMLLFKGENGPVSVTNKDQKQVALRFLENNIGTPSSDFTRKEYPNLYCGAYAATEDCYNVLFTMEELYFIQAEAYYWLGDKVKACELAKEATQMNIQRHLARYLLDNEGKYPNYNGSAVVSSEWWDAYVTAFLDNVGGGRYKILAASENGQKHYYFNPSAFTLSDLMCQKYIAMYMQPEQWTDMRRYHFSNNRNAYGVNDANEIVYPTLRRPYNLYKAYFVDGLSVAEQENTWIQRINYDPETEEKYSSAELERLGASMNHKWLLKPMNWAQARGVRTSLTAE